MSLFCRKKKKFGEILIEKGLATPEQVEEALKVQKGLREKKEIQKAIGAILCEKGVIDIEDIENVLKIQRQNAGFILRGFIYWIFHAK